MKSLRTIISGNLRKNKGAYIGIVVLMCIVSIAFGIVYNVRTNSMKRLEKKMETCGYGDYWSCVDSDEMLAVKGTSVDEIVAKLEASEAVSKVTCVKTFTRDYVKVGEFETYNTTHILDYSDEQMHFEMRDGDHRLVNNAKLSKGEVCVPITYQSMYNIKIGDRITFNLDADTEYHLTVKYFFEEPMMGGSVIGIKTLLVSPETVEIFDQAYEDAMARKDGELYINRAWSLNVFKADSHMNNLEFEKAINAAASLSSYAWISLTRSQTVGYTMLTMNLFSAVAGIFIVILLLAAFMVMGHSIVSSIEQDYVNIGIYKALGMTTTKIRMSLVCCYSLVAIVGLIIGLPVSLPLVNVVNNIMLATTGMVVKPRISIIASLIMMMLVVLCILFFVSVKSRKIGRITPVEALNEGVKSVHFSSLLQTKISARFLNLSLAYRQFTSNIKAYVSIVLVTAMLTVFLVLMNNVFAWTYDDLSLSKVFSDVNWDAYIVFDEEEEENIDQIIRQYTDYDIFSSHYEYLLLDDVNVQCNIISDPSKLSNVLEGRLCEYDNEIMITPYISKEFDLEIGDEVPVTVAANTKKMLVTGIYNTPYDLGRAFVMTTDAYQSFYPDDYYEKRDDMFGESEKTYARKYIQYEDSAKGEEVYDALNKIYQFESLDNSKDVASEDLGIAGFSQNNESNLDDNASMKSIAIAIRGLTLLVYVLGALFVSITIGLVANRMMTGEKKDFGIYKAIGISSGKLRNQMGLRFMLIGFVSAVIGAGLGMLVMQPVLGTAFYQFGIANFKASLHTSDLVIPIVFMTIVSFVFSYISSRKIKKVEPRILISE